MTPHELLEKYPTLELMDWYDLCIEVEMHNEEIDYLGYAIIGDDADLAEYLIEMYIDN